MVQVNKVDSNVTGLRYAEEASFKVLPGSPVWNALEPNTYPDFGGRVTTTSRNPISSDRQRKKGVVTDLDANGGFNQDLTQTNLQDVLQGYMFADFEPKGEQAVTAVDLDAANPDEYEVADTTGFQSGDLIQGQNFAEAANNAVNVVTTVTANVSVEVANGLLAAEAPPPSDARIVNVGHQAGSADINVVTAGNYAGYSSSALDFTTLGLQPGEWIFVGGDAANEDFVNAQNNGWKRVRSVAANLLTIDKSDSAMVAETGTGLTIRFYFGRVLRNRTGSNIKRRSYQLERTLGAPDDAQPAQIQAEYLIGQVPATFALNIPQADKVTCDLAFVGADSETIDGPTPLKSGDRPSIEEADAFNTSSDFSRINLAQHSTTDEAPTPLVAFTQNISITINNNVTPNKAVAVLGAFDVSVGTFEVGGSITAYFSNVSAVKAIKDNVDITLDAILVQGASGAKAGIAVDLPLITLGDGRPNVVQDQSITLPLEMGAATGASIDTALNHTLMMVFFDHLPNAADT